MTDSNTKANNLQSSIAKKSLTSTDKAIDRNKSKNPNSGHIAKNTEQRSKVLDSKETMYKPVNIMICGKSYTINCPVGEEAELKQASTYINNFVQDIRRKAPQSSPENLLVLCCLNLYEKIQQIEKSDNTEAAQHEKANLLVSKILSDTQSILK